MNLFYEFYHSKFRFSKAGKWIKACGFGGLHGTGFIKRIVYGFIFDACARLYPRAQDRKPRDLRKEGEAAISNGFPDFFIDGAHPVAAGALVLAVMDRSEMVLLDPCQDERLAGRAPFRYEFVLVLDFIAHNLLQDIMRVKVIHA
jgi:hypothetical protein